jgi:uroporphyrinogen decarboxylase
MNESGADVLSVDWRIPLSEARRRVPGRPLQGNLDPGLLLGGTREVRRRVRAMLAETGGLAHVVNLGHGVLPQTSVESASAFFEAVRRAGVAEADAAQEAEG